MRADQTTVNGGPAGSTPFLWSIYRDGARFSSTIANAPWTQPAVTSILTSRFALGIGMVSKSAGNEGQRLPDRVVTLAERFREAGYSTLGATANPNAGAAYGFDRGFDDYWTPVERWRGAVIKVDGGEIVKHVLSGLAERVETEPVKPFYLQLVLVDAHQPEDRQLAGSLFRLLDASVPAHVAAYRARLRHVDDSVAALDRGLRALGHDERDTVLMFVGDHGDGLEWPAGHGRGHGMYLYPSSVHVPWVARGPGIAAGRTIEGLAAQVDVAPTLQGLTGLPRDAGSEGFDWSALLRGEGAHTSRTETYVDTWFGNASRAAVYEDARFCQKDYRPSERPHGSAEDRGAFADGCCAWREDPGCASMSPLATADDLSLDSWRKAREAARVTFGAAGIDVSPDPGTAKALWALGYRE